MPPAPSLSKCWDYSHESPYYSRVSHMKFSQFPLVSPHTLGGECHISKPKLTDFRSWEREFSATLFSSVLVAWSETHNREPFQASLQPDRWPHQPRFDSLCRLKTGLPNLLFLVVLSGAKLRWGSYCVALTGMKHTI